MIKFEYYIKIKKYMIKINLYILNDKFFYRIVIYCE